VGREKVRDSRFVLWAFMALGDEAQKHAIYNLCCKTISKADDIDNDLEEIAAVVTDSLDSDHPWSKEVLRLVEKRKN